MPLHWTIDSKAKLLAMVADGPIELAELHRLLDVTTALKLEGYRKLASIYLAKSEKEMDGYVAEGALSEVKEEDEEED